MTGDLEYCDAIYQRFVERRAHSLVLPLRDWEQILAWRERQIPLPLILGVIDRNVEPAHTVYPAPENPAGAERRKKRDVQERSAGKRRPVRLTALCKAVDQAWLQLRQSQIGREKSPEGDMESFSLSFVLSRIVGPARTELLRSLPSGPAGKVVEETINRCIDRLRKRRSKKLNIRQVLRWELHVNRRLIQAAEKVASPDLRQQLQGRAEAAAAKAAGKESKVLQKKLYAFGVRHELDLPSLRLFQAEIDEETFMDPRFMERETT